MAKEIERKWLYNYEYGNVLDVCKDMPYYEVHDHYFNEFCRLRNVSGGVWFITIKSKGHLIRDEFEFMVDNADMDFLPTPVLKKTRHIVDIDEERSFEINVFRDILITSMGFAAPLITVEREYDSPYILGENLPDFCGTEITNDESYYGYNLFKILKEGTTSSFKSEKNNIIYLKDFVDKQK